MDPTCSWLKCAVLHELHECYLYHSFALHEVNAEVKKIWERHLDMEIGHLHDAVEMYKSVARKDPEEFIPMTMPQPTTFESNIQYVRKVLEEQTQLTARQQDYVNVHELPQDHRYFQWRQAVNGDSVPSNAAVQTHIDQQGQDYRFTTAEHPVAAYRQRTEPSGDYPPRT
jgi:hypothetical protein